MLTWPAIKLLLNNAWGFVAAHWRMVLICALIVYATYQTHAHHEAVTKLANLEASVKHATDKQIAEQAITYAAAKSTVNDAVSVAALDFKHFDLNRKASTKAIKDLYEKPSGNIIPINFDSLRKSDSGSEQTSQVATDTEGLTRNLSECDATVVELRYKNVTLENGCRITTRDFNVCRSVLDADTAMYGREDN